ncbi:hypothetical protein MARBORIA2_06720 [Methanobrevibacter arboriphilus]|jgi:energy-converting hydrogenase B subunit J|uniref:Uncharacterized protein n=1 Tax=Methanobrevibacter arboriphilus TaxID=39441 RepID=A0ACA8R5W9_METAZ|nr:energy-converting hydrogenase B subunit J [Methanobrevibacter arboriphilus]MCC7561488.1 energy-converting hydrogenase B subunit J [Methanobrevibacter arboriphilus]BBL62355.1 hypothetical protein MarbSA_13950 [Methanobrevibacter arboriphilus]GLI11582.1 hypothetical protein MARBORIA2_06720 [Methanobrevibacter arboriphilus]
MLYLGPVIFGFLIGFVVGIRVRNTSSINLTIGSYVIIFLVALIIAWQSGPYPFFDDVPISTSFLSAAIGLIVGNVIKKIISKTQ